MKLRFFQYKSKKKKAQKADEPYQLFDSDDMIYDISKEGSEAMTNPKLIISDKPSPIIIKLSVKKEEKINTIEIPFETDILYESITFFKLMWISCSAMAGYILANLPEENQRDILSKFHDNMLETSSQYIQKVN